MLRALNNAARAEGLRRGQSHADARAILPHLLGMSAEPEREAKALEQLAGWCERWSPSVALDTFEEGHEGLFLDMTGGAHLFGGEAALLGDMSKRLAMAGVEARLALADTPGAAWAAARFSGRRGAIIPPGGAREALATLPVAAMRLDADTLRLAGRFGLKRIDDLMNMPRAGLARRFRGVDALGLVRRLDQATGVEPEVLPFQRPAPLYRAAAIFAEPLLDAPGIAARLGGLADALAAKLEADAMGARALTLAAFRTDGRVVTLSVRIGRPSRDTKIWARLLREKGIERLDPGFGIDALALSADLVEPLAERQGQLEGGEEDAGERLSTLVDRLAARLGDKAVLKSCAHASWLPERASRWVPAQAAPASPGLDETRRTRPILLLDPPEPIEASLFVVPEGAPEQFKWRRVTRRVTRAEGPERLAPEWWRNPTRPRRTRDYYRVEDDQGHCYWLFREGLYGWEDGERDPSWWMHGLFP